MNLQNFFIKSKSTLLGLFVAIAGVAPVLADDTEIYVGGSVVGPASRPNILFVVDTSGSMGGMVDVTPAYDAATDYSLEPGACFGDPTKVYYDYRTHPRNIECGASEDRFFLKSAIVCDAAAIPLGGTTGSSGIFTDRVARYQGSSRRWRTISSNGVNDHAEKVECRADSGVHGAVAGDTFTYPRNNNVNAWSASSNQQIRWRDYRTRTFFTANYINYTLTAGVSQSITRLQVVQRVVTELVNSTSAINIGLMRFNTNNHGGSVVTAVQPIETISSSFITKLNSFTHSNNTPVSESMYEAALYFRGDEHKFGRSGTGAGTTDPLAKGDWASGKYKSPIEYECQYNAAVLLTDGEPTWDVEANSLVPALPNSGITRCRNSHGDTDGMCLDELAGYMSREDQIADGILNKDQKVNTYTIGFKTDQALLRDTAIAGGGIYRTAENIDDLTDAFRSILNQILEQNTTFSSPAVAVNAFSQTTHRNELYFTLFEPSTMPFWHGNLKKYVLAKNATTKVTQIQDANGAPAVDPTTGYFTDAAKSFWSSEADGLKVREGGLANSMPATPTVYTYTGTAEPVGIALATAEHKLHETNAAITDAMLNIQATDTVTSQTLLEWARWKDTKGLYPDPYRSQLGDPLHSQATVVQYGGTETFPDLSIFYGSNDGYVHAVKDNGASVQHQFSFMPPEMLPNLRLLYSESSTVARPYGMDGPITTWVYDKEKDGIINPVDDHVYLYVGMRRGGTGYYALDVTDRTTPSIKWRITKTPTGSYSELGQTWSEPLVKQVKINNAFKRVLIFGGGYDAASQDDAGPLTVATSGRAIYIADAETGARLWWAGPIGSGADLELENLKYSVPSKVYAADINGNTAIDRLYFTDTGGQMFRIDIDESNTAMTNFATGGRMAVLGKNGVTNADARRFYQAMSVGLVSIRGRRPYLAIALGSGWRAHPNDKIIQDRIYMIRDTAVFNPPTDYMVVAEESTDLFDATTNTIGEGVAVEKSVARALLASKKGWFISLQENPGGDYVGEKVLADAIILGGKMIIPTFRPAGSTSGVDTCGPDAGKGRAYLINIEDATPTQNFDNIGPDDQLTRNDRYIDLQRSGLAPTTTVHIGKDGITAIAGTEIIKLDFSTVMKTNWFER